MKYILKESELKGMLEDDITYICMSVHIANVYSKRRVSEGFPILMR